MNKTVPTGRLYDTEAERNAQLRRKSKLRPINTGNVYDVTGKLRKLLHEIESGRHGKVTDLIVALRSVQENRIGIKTAFMGTSQPEVLHYMACRLEDEIL